MIYIITYIMIVALAVFTSLVKPTDRLSRSSKILLASEFIFIIFLLFRAAYCLYQDFSISSLFVRCCFEIVPAIFVGSLAYSLIRGEEDLPKLEEE